MGRGVTRPVRETAQCPKSNPRNFNGISPDREAVESPVMDELKQQRRGLGSPCLALSCLTSRSFSENPADTCGLCEIPPSCLSARPTLAARETSFATHPAPERRDGSPVRCRSRCVIRLLGGRRGTGRRLRDHRSRRRRPTRGSRLSRSGRNLWLAACRQHGLTGHLRNNLCRDSRHGPLHIHIEVQT